MLHIFHRGVFRYGKQLDAKGFLIVRRVGVACAVAKLNKGHIVKM